MNLQNVDFNLQWAIELLQECREAIQSGELTAGNESRLGDDLGFVLDKLCVAWNARNSATYEVGHSSPSEIKHLTKTVPNFGGDRQMGDPVW
jgi:hypothetical protein